MSPAGNSAPVLLSRREGAVAWLTLNRPEKRNALSASLIAALSTALRAADEDPAVRVVVLAGAGKDFCAGADLTELQALAGAGALENLRDADTLGDLFLLPRSMTKPVLAAVRGRALAGGFGLASACDMVVAEESARFGYPEVAIGFVPAMVTALLRRNVPEKRAFELICLGATFPAADAERLGLINRVVPDGELEARVGELAAALAERSASALHLSKRLLYQQDGMTIEAAVRLGAGVNAIARATDDARAGIGRFAGNRREAE